MRKILILLFIFCLFFQTSANAKLFEKKDKPVLILTSEEPEITAELDLNIKNETVFKKNSRIYFVIYTKKGFKSDYLKYQIVQQNENAFAGGFNRIRNVRVRVKNKNYYKDYFTLSQTGKYFIQIFDIENLQHWLAIGAFKVINE